MADNRRKVLITGATGFIGSALAQQLCSQYEVVGLSRNVEKASKLLGGEVRVVEWDGRTRQGWANEADGAFAIVNLAGQNIASGRWTKTAKERILQSRLDAIGAVVDAVENVERRPEVVIQASAIGYYGSRGEEELDEDSTGGEGFLAEVCRKIEKAVRKIAELGVRLVVIRTGVVLGLGGGALPRFAAPFRFYLGGYVGSAEQRLSWIGLSDEVGAIRFLMEHEALSGAFNLTSPRPVNVKEFAKTLGHVLNKPAWTSVPGFVIRLGMGQMGTEVLLGSQHVLPKRLIEAGFEFEHSDLGDALRCIYKRKE